jgi:hypothetical protein
VLSVILRFQITPLVSSNSSSSITSYLFLFFLFKQWWSTGQATYKTRNVYLSRQIIELNKTTIYIDEHLSLGFGQAHRRGVVNLVNGIQTLLYFYHWISNGNPNIKIYTSFLALNKNNKKVSYILDDWIMFDSKLEFAFGVSWYSVLY